MTTAAAADQGEDAVGVHQPLAALGEPPGQEGVGGRERHQPGEAGEKEVLAARTRMARVAAWNR